jgi:uncharacterized protein YndB with AHSA1/START domain
MTDTPAADDAERGYTITRTYEAPRALVWRAITEADLFARWFGAETELVVHSWDLRPGGEWRGTMTYEGNEIPWLGRFIEVDEPERLVLAITDEGELTEPLELITYTLAEADGRTELVLRQSGGGLTDEQYQQAKEGSSGFLDELGKVVASL